MARNEKWQRKFIRKKKEERGAANLAGSIVNKTAKDQERGEAAG